MPLVQRVHGPASRKPRSDRAISDEAMGAVVDGVATLEELDQALAAVHNGPLSGAALDGLAELRPRLRGRGALTASWLDVRGVPDRQGWQCRQPIRSAGHARRP